MTRRDKCRDSAATVSSAVTRKQSGLQLGEPRARGTQRVNRHVEPRARDRAPCASHHRPRQRRLVKADGRRAGCRHAAMALSTATRRQQPAQHVSRQQPATSRGAALTCKLVRMRIGRRSDPSFVQLPVQPEQYFSQLDYSRLLRPSGAL